MPVHLLVTQLRFTRSEFVRSLAGVTEEEATRRILPMNCISWIVGHLANQERRYWVMLAQGVEIHPELNDLVGTGRPASTPSLADMWSAWREITRVADRYLDTVTPGVLQTHFNYQGESLPENIGARLMRNIYHYWYHTGEAAAVRQMLGHKDLPQFVGDMSSVVYYPES